ncbi:binary toxin-like calcium binding domain-containing protein [Clostridium sp. Marseille-Q2269]|uniref:binary toxin-like calcium binding domain-containing protein n=1 Tax=Clostridium sp. Marseille-Q2269 TaxID=2942205 RepID=UPI00207307F3|nr:binary toxin-like calcium binding domain-containing protein [Clostridium sp. Marseille-Q2269]
MKRALIGILTCSVILSTISSFPAYAAKNDESANTSINEKEQDGNNIDRKGLLGYYYKGKDFKNLIFFAQTQSENLSYDQDKVHELINEDDQKFASVRWVGLINTNKNGTYKFKCSHDENMIIAINGDIVSNLGNDKKEITLEKDKPVFIEINYRINSDKTFNNDTFKNMQIFKINNEGEEIEINRDELLTPDNSKPLSEKNMISSSKKSLSSDNEEIDEDTDTDGDSIPDLWEENGYTIQRKVAVKWDDKFAEQGYIKYLSNPYQAYTAGDPYTDWEKAAGDIPASNAAATHNPLVAAFPSINVDMRKMILSKDSNLSNSAESHSNNSYTYANSEGASIEAGFGPKGFSVGASANYQHTETVGSDWGSSKSNTEQFNSASAGYLNANVHYNNVGTGGIYDAQPTTSFILKDSTIATITAKSNATALSIPSESRYPASKEGISLKTMDDFNSHPITLNKSQLNAVLNNEVIKINTDQTDGRYGIIKSDGKPEIGDRWAPIMDQIKGRTASIIIDPDDGKALETRIAAKNYKNPEDKTPSLTIKEGLKIAYPEAISEDKDGILFYEYTDNEGKSNKKQLSEESVMTYTDEDTSKEFKRQLSDGSAKGLYDIKLTPKMNITIRLATLTLGFDDKFSSYPWENATWSDKLGNLRLGSLAIPQESKYTIPKDKVKPNYDYLITGYIKHDFTTDDESLNIIAFTKKDNHESWNIGTSIFTQNSGGKFKKFTIETQNISYDYILDSIKLIKRNNDVNKIDSYLDDIAIIPIGPNKSR